MCGQLESFFQLTACFSASGNGGVGVLFCESNLKQLQPASNTRDLELETANQFMNKVEHLVLHGGAESIFIGLDKCIDLAWPFLEAVAHSWYTRWNCL